MEYIVIEANSVEELESEINESIAEGWQLQGGVSVVYFEIPITGKNVVAGSKEQLYKYFQAMIRTAPQD